ncbi:uncharacterized protein LOC127245948 [Andrographis paniculata]|uniref:uncharacterized protein LOC127245948 n=1 Tax=Andrographis paniculata TaxID=175694 RepID=UPI0021E86FB8|nr:uncharacterized protein LOC127245948 [Andrographis paniculata]
MQRPKQNSKKLNLHTRQVLVYYSVHACNARSFAATTLNFNQESRPTKIEGSLKGSINYNPNRVLSKHTVNFNPKEIEDFGKKNKESGEWKCSHHKKLLQHYSESEGSRWARVNVRNMDLHEPFFGDKDLSETDYQPPHRKAPIHNK